MSLWIQLALEEVRSLLLLSFITRTPSPPGDLKLQWTPAGGKRQLWTAPRGCESISWFFFLSRFLKVEENWLCKRGRTERMQTQPAGSSAPPLGALLQSSSSPSPVRPDTCHSRARWGPGPTHERASVGSAILRVNPLPLGGCWLSFVLQLQTKPQVRSSQVSADSVILSGVYWKRRFHPFFFNKCSPQEIQRSAWKTTWLN